jgi:DNA-binding CsgD family transcriptional regulator
MLQYLVYLVFIVSVALAAGGVFISSKLRDKYHHEIFSTLLYFQAFIFTFGFYGIWGQAVIKAFLTTYISEEMLIRITDISILLGLPFLVFAWVMLIRFSLIISGRRSNGWFLFWFLLLNFSVIIVVGYFITKAGTIKPVSLIKYYFIAMNSLYILLSSFLILFKVKGRPIIHEYDRKIIGTILLFILLAQSAPLLFYKSQAYVGMIFIFTFFAGNTFLPVYLNYGTLLTAFTDSTHEDLSFEDFCKKFEVSPRETDIVREICSGLSNKEISEKLFISLQTVKDHTHRIYIKTNVKSRVQLINLVKDTNTSGTG